MNCKYYIGPMSKNVVDTTIEFCNETNNIICLIPSRRQIEWNGGYVNNWNTKDFSEYVKPRTDKIFLQRDHAGPGQGNVDDNGYISLFDDCSHLDLIHIDPWKKYSTFNDGLKWTVEMIKSCDSLNPNLQYEVGTEESIRRFETSELSEFMYQLQYQLPLNVYEKIKYLVIQSGTSLKGTTQTGKYDSNRLMGMIDVCKRFGVLSKEHNGDYISTSVIKEKFDMGLDAINIAPEFGVIETQTYIDEIGNDDTILNKFWQICYRSEKWKKWVNSDFDPQLNKIELIKICGHYVLSTSEFIKIKSQFPDIDQKIKVNIKNKLNELYRQK